MKKRFFKSLIILLSINIGMWAFLFTAASADDFFINGQIWNTHHPDGSLHTNIDIGIGDDFPGALPGDVDTITVAGPSGPLYDKDDFEYIEQFRSFSLVTDGAPEIGEYTFTVTSGALTGTDTDFQSVIRTIPVPDTSTFSPVEGATHTSKTPSFSWGPVDYTKTAIYYRLVISDLQGNWVFFTSRTQGMLSFTLPEGELDSGQYLYRVECHDSSNFNTLQNRSQSEWLTFTVAGLLTHSATPAFDPRDWNAVTWSTTYGTGLLCSATVIDHDGVSYDGSSHSVTVELPGSGTHELDHYSSGSGTSAYYSVYVGGMPQGGDYTFTVTDPDGNVGTFTDTLNVNTLAPPDENSFTPTLKDEYVTASIDNVEVNGGPYDNFNAYGSIYDLDPNKWWQPGDCASIENNAVKFTVNYPIGGQACRLAFKDPASINSIRAHITVHDASEGAISAIPPRARIMGTFYNNGIEDVYAHVSVTRDKVYYNVWGDSSGDTLATGDLISVNLDQTVNAAISWDGTTLTFEADETTASYTPTGTVNDPTNAYKEIGANIFLYLPDTTPIFTWDPVEDANRYRVRIYSSDNQRTIWNGYPGNQTSYTIPPGVLAPHTTYRYRIEAWDAHSPLDVDNISKSPASNNDNYMFITGDQSVDPFIDLDSGGVQIWNDAGMGPHLSFWIKVHDAQGVPGDIKSVTVQFPNNGPEKVLYYDYQQSSTCGIYRSDSFLPIESGTYTFRVEDKGGHIATLAEDLTPAAPPLGYPAETSLTHAVTNGTSVDFTWEDVSDAAFYRVEIYDKDYHRVYALPTTVSEYQLPAGLLKENTLYRYRITTRAEFFSQNIDNGSSSPWIHWTMPTFMTTPVTGGSSNPSIDLDDFGVYTVHITKPGSADSMYQLAFEVKVTDQDGVPGNIKSVRVTYPDATTRDLIYLEHISATEARYLFIQVYDDFNDIIQGDYKFKVTDFDDKVSEELTDDLTIDVLPIPTNCTPAQDSTVIGTTQTIDWNDVDGAQSYSVRVYDGWNNLIHRSDFLTESTYTIPPYILEVGKTYSYRISAYREEGPGEDIDNCSIHPLYAGLRYHFTIGNTETGSVVEVQPVDTETGDTPVTITFDEVTDPGTTSLTTSEEGVTPPLGFMLGDPPTYYDITTTAEVSGPIEVCVYYGDVSYDKEEQLRFYHYENEEWVDVTSSLDMEDDIICGEVDSLSAFAIFEFEGAQYCTTLGDDPKPSILDQDIFTFDGTEGEEVSIKMAVDPLGSYIGRRATLILKDKISGVRFVRRDRSALPNEINAKLPATGEYRIIVAEQPKRAPGMKFRGDYCLTMGSSGGASETLEPTGWVE